MSSVTGLFNNRRKKKKRSEDTSKFGNSHAEELQRIRPALNRSRVYLSSSSHILWQQQVHRTRLRSPLAFVHAPFRRSGPKASCVPIFRVPVPLQLLNGRFRLWYLAGFKPRRLLSKLQKMLLAAAVLSVSRESTSDPVSGIFFSFASS